MYRFEIPRMSGKQIILLFASGLPAGIVGFFVFPIIFHKYQGMDGRIGFLLGIMGYYAIVEVMTEIIRR